METLETLRAQVPSVTQEQVNTSLAEELARCILGEAVVFIDGRLERMDGDSLGESVLQTWEYVCVDLLDGTRICRPVTGDLVAEAILIAQGGAS